MTSLVLSKIRLPSGNLAVYDAQPQHRGQAELIRMYGAHLYTQIDGVWFDVRWQSYRPVAPDVSKALSAQPIDWDTAPGLAWGIQSRDSDTARWVFLGPTGGEPYRFESRALALEALQAKYPQLEANGRTALFGEPLVEPLLRADFFDEDGEPTRCIHCGGRHIGTKTTSFIDVGVGRGIPCEECYLCLDCNETVGYWAYGYFDPAFANELPAAVSS